MSVLNVKARWVHCGRRQHNIDKDVAREVLRLAARRELPLPLGEATEVNEICTIYDNALLCFVPYLDQFTKEESIQLILLLRDPIWEDQLGLEISLIDTWNLASSCNRLFLLAQPSITFMTTLFKQFFSKLVSLDEKVHLVKRVFVPMLCSSACRFFVLVAIGTFCTKAMNPRMVKLGMQVLEIEDDEPAFQALYPLLHSYARVMKFPRLEDHYAPTAVQ